MLYLDEDNQQFFLLNSLYQTQLPQGTLPRHQICSLQADQIVKVQIDRFGLLVVRYFLQYWGQSLFFAHKLLQQPFVT